MQNPKVSICIHTYNHGNFIRQTLDGVINQKVNFEYEIVVGDDCSSDNNQEILKEYQEKYPDLIRLNLFKEKNKGIPGKTNFMTTYHICRGEYIVTHDGDDYVINENKLQLQADFLDSNPQFSACFHNAEVRYEQETVCAYLVNPPEQESVITPYQLLAEKEVWFMATTSVMLRRAVLPTLPPWFEYSKSGDIPIYILLSHQSPIGYINLTMSVYRKNKGGMSYTDDRADADFIHNRIFMYSSINQHTNYKYNNLIKPILAQYYLMLPNTRQYINTIWERLYYTFRSVLYQYPKQFTVKEILMYYAFSENTIKKLYKIFKVFK